MHNCNRSENYSIEEAINGEQGVRIAKKIIPDLIISDLNFTIDFSYINYFVVFYLLLSILLSSKAEGSNLGINLMKIGNKTAPPGKINMASDGMLLKISMS